MKQWKSNRVAGAAVGATLALGAASWAAGGSRLVMNGKTASTDVRLINGAAYVRVADVAKALGMVAVKSAGGYEIKKPGGASQVGNLSGKVGDVLFDGQWRFQVLEVKAMDSYSIKSPGVMPASGADELLHWNRDTNVISAVPNYRLILFRCRVTNGQKTKETLWTAPTDKDVHTALADTEGGSHVPAAYDYLGAATQTKPMLPGQVLTFPLLFSVPRETQLKDLIFTLRSNSAGSRSNDVRVSLAGVDTSGG